MWEDATEAEANIGWTRSLAATEPFATGGVYVNGAGSDTRASALYGANYNRLVEIKTAYDPTNFFRHNQNIRPKAKSAVESQVATRTGAAKAGLGAVGGGNALASRRTFPQSGTEHPLTSSENAVALFVCLTAPSSSGSLTLGKRSFNGVL
jgi:hypothetical protein